MEMNQMECQVDFPLFHGKIIIPDTDNKGSHFWVSFCSFVSKKKLRAQIQSLIRGPKQLRLTDCGAG